MSSPLDARIRAAAREEVATALGGAPATGSSGAERIEALEKAVTRLYDNQRRLDARLDALEKTAASQEPETKPAVRRTRKAADE
jgi:hypothetical protein